MVGCLLQVDELDSMVGLWLWLEPGPPDVVVDHRSLTTSTFAVLPSHFRIPRPSLQNILSKKEN